MSTSARKILLVDDDLTLAEMYSERMKAAGYEVITAHDGEAAVAAAKEHHPDLVLMDIMMPKMNGFDALRQIKEADDTKDIPVVMLTALIQDLDKNKKGAANGAAGYFVKSETMPGDLLAKIEEVLGHPKAAAEAA